MRSFPDPSPRRPRFWSVSRRPGSALSGGLEHEAPYEWPASEQAGAGYRRKPGHGSRYRQSPGARRRRCGADLSQQTRGGRAYRGIGQGDQAYGSSPFKRTAQCPRRSPPRSRNATEHIDTLLHGLNGKTIDGTTYAARMPAFAATLFDIEITDIVDHERTSWGRHTCLAVRYPEGAREGVIWCV